MNVFKLGVTFVKSLSALFVPGKCPKRIDNEKIVAGETVLAELGKQCHLEGVAQ